MRGSLELLVDFAVSAIIAIVVVGGIAFYLWYAITTIGRASDYIYAVELHTAECQSIGGIYVEQKENNLCIVNGEVVKTYDE